MLVPKARSGRPVIAIASLIIISIGSGCNDQRNQPECSDVYKSRLDQSEFEVFDGGMALHKPTGLTVTQCAVGQRMSNYRCRGASLKLSWDGAMAYAAEVADKTGEPWRLPEKDEIPTFWRIDALTPQRTRLCSRALRSLISGRPQKACIRITSGAPFIPIKAVFSAARAAISLSLFYW